MAQRLKDNVAIVTGSTQGIGRAVARLFAAEGASVVLNSHVDDGHALTMRAGLGDVALYVRADLARGPARPAAEHARQAQLLPVRRIGEPEEVAYTALFLAGDEARFINAADILVDGGRSQLYHE